MNPPVLNREHEWLNVAQTALRAEADAIIAASERLDGALMQAITLILNCPGKIVITGMGKSGHVGQKLAATFCSTGTPAVFLHASDAFHGDIGIYAPGDVTIMLSKSGTTAELLKLIPVVREFHSPLIGILGNLRSPLAERCDVVLDSSVQAEVDPNNLAPTSSTTVAMAIGDALAATLVHARSFTAEDFARYHPGGQLGRNLRLRVNDVMHRDARVAWVDPDDTVKAVMIAMTQHPLGAACVVDAERHLLGLITDGDLRRALLAHDDIRHLHARDIMTVNPTTIAPDETLKQALYLMESRKSQISVLPVLDEARDICCGLIRIHDIYRDAERS